MRACIICLCAAALAVSAATAQAPCANITVTGTGGPLEPIRIDLTSSPARAHDAVILAIGHHLGAWQRNISGLNIVLGVSDPVFGFPGQLDADGRAHWTIIVPPYYPAKTQRVQALIVDFIFHEVCTSNVVSFEVDPLP